MAEGRGDVIRRKLGAARAEAAVRAGEGAPGPDKAWRLALSRAARDRVKLALDVPRMALDRMSLAEILELAPERGLIAVLEGPLQALGVILLGPDVLAGMIEAQTTGIVTKAAAPDRRPTRTDAAMAAGMIDGALEEFERAVAGMEGAEWAQGFRYASFLEDIRPLGLLLDDIPYRLLRAEVSLAFGAKTGSIFMALPADPRSQGSGQDEDARATVEAQVFAQAMAGQVMASACTLDGVLARVSLTLAQVMGFEMGQVLPLGGASVDRISLEGRDGRKLWEGKLGQNRGLCAVRLTEQARQPGAPAPRGEVLEPKADHIPALRATGTG